MMKLSYQQELVLLSPIENLSSINRLAHNGSLSNNLFVFHG